MTMKFFFLSSPLFFYDNEVAASRHPLALSCLSFLVFFPIMEQCIAFTASYLLLS